MRDAGCCDPAPDRSPSCIPSATFTVAPPLEISNVNRLFAVTPIRAATLGLALALSGCSSIESFLAGDKVDYRSQAGKTAPLHVPPDLTRLARDAIPAAVRQWSAPTRCSVALARLRRRRTHRSHRRCWATMRIERLGKQRWLVTSVPAEQAVAGVAFVLAGSAASTSAWTTPRSGSWKPSGREPGQAAAGLHPVGHRQRSSTPSIPPASVTGSARASSEPPTVDPRCTSATAAWSRCTAASAGFRRRGSRARTILSWRPSS